MLTAYVPSRPRKGAGLFVFRYLGLSTATFIIIQYIIMLNCIVFILIINKFNLTKYG